VNTDRLQLPKNCNDLALWLSGVVWDAIRDAKEAGLSDKDAWILLGCVDRMLDPTGLHRTWDRDAKETPVSDTHDRRKVERERLFGESFAAVFPGRSLECGVSQTIMDLVGEAELQAWHSGDCPSDYIRDALAVALYRERSNEVNP
jgi:hypothetical protein